MTIRTLSEIAERCGASLQGDGDRRMRGPSTLRDSGPDHVSLFTHPKYKAEFAETRAGAVVVAADFETDRDDVALLRCSDPNRAFTEVIRCFVPEEVRPPAGVDSRAIIDPRAALGEGVSIGPFCSVGAGARIGSGVRLDANVVVGPGASVGADSWLHPNVTVYGGVSIGERCVIHAGAVVGSEGFGFEPTADGWQKIPQVGSVVLEDEVELGACVTVDRARFGATRVGRGSKVDNQVHIAHNVEVGAGALIIAQTGIAGSARIGTRAILAGQTGVSGHVEIGAGARVAAKSGVTSDLRANCDYLGNPARPRAQTLRHWGHQRRIPALLERLTKLENELAQLAAREEKGN